MLPQNLVELLLRGDGQIGEIFLLLGALHDELTAGVEVRQDDGPVGPFTDGIDGTEDRDRLLACFDVVLYALQVVPDRPSGEPGQYQGHKQNDGSPTH